MRHYIAINYVTNEYKKMTGCKRFAFVKSKLQMSLSNISIQIVFPIHVSIDTCEEELVV